MKMTRKVGKLNNKGFSMVEVITAVVLITVVAIPLLHTFITSMRVNEKAKNMQQITAATESLMEGFKAYSYDDLIDQFKNSNLKIYNSSDIEGFSYKDATTDTSLNLPTTNNKGNAATIKGAVFNLKGMKYFNNKYDAKVSLLPYESSTLDKHNGTKEFNQFERMNGYKDGVYRQPLDSVTNSYYTLLTGIAAKLNEIDKIYGYVGEDPSLGYKPDMLDMTKIKVTRESNFQLTDKKVTATITYKATTVNYPYYDEWGNVQLLNGYEPANVVITEDCYDTTAISEAGATLENLYLFVYPVYKTDLSGYRFESDKYTIEYDGSSDVDVFFVKQLNSTIPDDKLVTCENQNPISGTIKNINIYHNLDENLGNDTMHTALTDPFSKFSSTNHSSLFKEDDSVMIYKVVIDIYEYGQYDAGFSGSPLYTMEGSMSE